MQALSSPTTKGKPISFCREIDLILVRESVDLITVFQCFQHKKQGLCYHFILHLSLSSQNCGVNLK